MLVVAALALLLLVHIEATPTRQAVPQLTLSESSSGAVLKFEVGGESEAFSPLSESKHETETQSKVPVLDIMQLLQKISESGQPLNNCDHCKLLCCDVLGVKFCCP
jgi:hypothetical protein